MKIGYACLNRSLGCSSARTFRLASYAKERFLETVAGNLSCLERTLAWNVERGLFFFRITSDIIPFASHPICRIDWAKRFATELRRIGRFVRRNRMRISMHPDQFVLINALEARIVKNSIRELVFHARLLDAMGLGRSAKIQLHVGGVYGDKVAALERFAKCYRMLPAAIVRRLVIENDERLYCLADCLRLHAMTGVPILFDVYHHELFNRGESVHEALEAVGRTWKRPDGVPMIDYSSKRRGHRFGAHAERIDLRHFRRFLEASRPIDIDVMLEIKDKEMSAIRALDAARGDRRLVC